MKTILIRLQRKDRNRCAQAGKHTVWPRKAPHLSHYANSNNSDYSRHRRLKQADIMMNHHLHTTDETILLTLVAYTLPLALSKRGHEVRLSETTQQAIITLSAKMKTKDAHIKHEGEKTVAAFIRTGLLAESGSRQEQVS